MYDKKYHIKTEEEMREDALLERGHRDKEVNPEKTNFTSECPRCGFINERMDIIEQQDKLTVVYKCRNCGQKFADYFGISL